MITTPLTMARWLTGSVTLLLGLAACAATPEPPPPITLSADPLRVTIEQRKTKEVPELSVRFRLGDVTEHRVLFEVIAPDGVRLIDKRSIIVDETVKLPLGTQTFFVTLTELHDFPTGDDFAVFGISATSPQPAQPPMMTHPSAEVAGVKLTEAEKGGAPSLAEGVGDEPADEGDDEPADEGDDEPADEGDDEPAEEGDDEPADDDPDEP